MNDKDTNERTRKETQFTTTGLKRNVTRRKRWKHCYRKGWKQKQRNIKEKKRK